MHDFAFGFLIRSAVLVPTLIIVFAGTWLVLNNRGGLRRDLPFNSSDMRTWPLSFATFEATIYGAIFAAIVSALGDGAISIAVAAAAASLIAIGAVPSLLSFRRK
jgi:hypothetical protein